MVAIDRASPAVVTRLIDAGADVNAPIRNRETPLLLAIDRGSPAVVTRLIDAGADVNTSNGLRLATPLHFAIAKIPDIPPGPARESRIRRFFRELFALRVAPPRGLQQRLSVVTVLLDAGADPSVKDADGAIPLDLMPSYTSPTDVYQRLVSQARAGSQDAEM